MWKKVLGYVLRLIAILSVFSLLGNLFGLVAGNAEETTDGKMETLLAIVFAGFIAVFLFKYSSKLINANKPD